MTGFDLRTALPTEPQPLPKNQFLNLNLFTFFQESVPHLIEDGQSAAATQPGPRG